MFAPRRGRVDINPGGSPEFQVQYIGKTEAFQATGIGCTSAHVQKLWDSSPEERFLKRALLTINSSGILLKFPDTRKDPEIMVDIEDISYCSAQKDVHERVFSWICKRANEKGRGLECHAVLCSSKEKAQTICLVLSRAFHIAYREWKLDKEKQKRSSKQNKVLRLEDKVTVKESTGRCAIRAQQNGSADKTSHVMDGCEAGCGSNHEGFNFMSEYSNKELVFNGKGKNAIGVKDIDEIELDGITSGEIDLAVKELKIVNDDTQLSVTNNCRSCDNDETITHHL